MKGGKKENKPGKVECSKKTFNNFNLHANRAAIPRTFMVMLAGDQSFGGNNRKNNTDRHD